MKWQLFSLMTLVILLMVTGCNSSEPAEEVELPTNTYQESLDKARAVEQDVLEAAERQRKAIEEQDG